MIGNSLISHGMNSKFTFKSTPNKIDPNSLFQSLYSVCLLQLAGQ
jgi:hypothetical protein